MNKDSGVALAALKVDGGMVFNETLMQFQSDILGVPVIRPTVAETTALGAAYAAGLAVGFWKNTDELRENWGVDKTWEPKMDADPREAAQGLAQGCHTHLRLGIGSAERTRSASPGPETHRGVHAEWPTVNCEAKGKTSAGGLPFSMDSLQEIERGAHMVGRTMMSSSSEQAWWAVCWPVSLTLQAGHLLIEKELILHGCLFRQHGNRARWIRPGAGQSESRDERDRQRMWDELAGDLNFPLNGGVTMWSQSARRSCPRWTCFGNEV